MAESLNGVYKTECYNRKESWEDAPEIELDTSSWANWYNTARPHSSLGGLTPIEYENAYYNGELPEPGETPKTRRSADPTDATSHGTTTATSTPAPTNLRDKPASTKAGLTQGG